MLLQLKRAALILMFKKILAAYNLEPGDVIIEEFGMGLINKTWKVERNDRSGSYILQKLNHAVFKQPEHIAFNVANIARHLQQQHPGYLFITPIATIGNQELYYDEQLGYFRLTPSWKTPVPSIPYKHPSRLMKLPGSLRSLPACALGLILQSSGLPFLIFITSLSGTSSSCKRWSRAIKTGVPKPTTLLLFCSPRLAL